MNERSLNKTNIITNAKEKWDSKSNANRVRAGSKYQHFLEKFELRANSWANCFDKLSKRQQCVLIKGELIRTYDSLPNISKTKIMHEFGLSVFSSKWYKLPGKDKKILLNYLIK